MCICSKILFLSYIHAMLLFLFKILCRLSLTFWKFQSPLKSASDSTFRLRSDANFVFFSPSYLLKTSKIEGTDSALCCWVNFNSLPFLDSEVRLHPLYYNFKRPPSAKWCMDSYNFTTKLVPTVIRKVGEKIPTLDANAGRWKTGIVFIWQFCNLIFSLTSRWNFFHQIQQ